MKVEIKEAKKKVKTFVDEHKDEVILVGGMAVGILAIRAAARAFSKNNVSTDTSGQSPWSVCNDANKQQIAKDIFCNVACKIEDAVFDDNVTNFTFEQLYDVDNEGVSGKLVTVTVEDYTF